MSAPVRRDSPSHELWTSNKKHPMHLSARVIAENNAFLVKCKNVARSNVRLVTPQLPDMQHLVQVFRERGYEGKIKDIIRDFIRKERAKPVVEEYAPVDPKHLYGRISKADAIDVGTGTGRKIKPFLGNFGSVVLFEKEKGKCKIKTMETANIKVIESEFDDMGFKNKILISLNSMTQNRDWFLNTEGVHIIPDLVGRLRDGLAVQEGDKIVSVGRKATYVDYYRPWPFQELVGHHGVNVYLHEEIQVVLSSLGCEGRLKSLPAIGQPLREWQDMPDTQPTVKLDGEKYTLWSDGGNVVMQSRDGEYRKGITNVKHRIHLELEVTPDGKVYLLEVKHYRGFKPFHSLSLLEYFLKAKKLTVGGIVVSPPPRFNADALHPYFEGVVFRVGGKDYHQRAVKSFDVDEKNYNIIPTFLKSRAIRCAPLNPWNWSNQIMEVLIMREETFAWVHVLKSRKKNKVDDFVRMSKIFESPAMTNGTVLMKQRLGIQAPAFDAKVTRPRQ